MTGGSLSVTGAGARKRAGMALTFAGALAVAGCSSVSGSGQPSGGSGGGAQPTSLSGGAVSVADPIAEFAVNAQEGANRRLTVNGRNVWVLVGQRYTSALGNDCRRITLRGASEGARVSAVCRHNGTWKTVLDL